MGNGQENGLYTKVPDVLLMTCSLSDEALMLFSRIYSRTKFENYTFNGTVREIAEVFGMKRDKVHRNMVALRDAKLATVGRGIITLNMKDLWELNKAYDEGIEIAIWTNLETALNFVRKIRQLVANTGQEIREIGQNVRNIRQGERKNETKMNKDLSKNLEEDKLSPSAQSFYSHWVTLDYPKEAAKVLDTKLAEQCERLAPDVTTMEELISLCEYCLKMLPVTNDGKLWAANLIKWKDDWKKDKSQPTLGYQEDDIYYQGMEIPGNVERAIEKACKQKWGTRLTHSVINKAFQEIEMPPKSFETFFTETMEKADSPDDVLARMKRWVTTGTR